MGNEDKPVILNDLMREYQAAVDKQDAAALKLIQEKLSKLGVVTGKEHRMSNGQIWVYPLDETDAGAGKTLIAE